MIRRPSPKAVSTAIPSRAEVAAALAAAGLLASSTAHAWPSDPPGAGTATAPTQDTSGQATGTATSTDTGDYPGWFPPSTGTATDSGERGLLVIDHPIAEMTVEIDSTTADASEAATGYSLPVGHHRVVLGTKSYGAGMVLQIDVAAGQSVHIDAQAKLLPYVEAPLGGAPPEEHFQSGCCGATHTANTAGGPARAPGSAALAALVLAAFGVRRRKR